MIVWLGRDSYEYYEIGKRKKDWRGPDSGFAPRHVLLEVETSLGWERMTGIKLKPGELVKCEITKVQGDMRNPQGGFTFMVLLK